MHLIHFFIVFIVSAFKTSGFEVGSSTCDCLNLVYIDQPKYIQECYSKIKFQNQVFQNFNNVYNQLLFHGIRKQCNFAEYVNFIKGMEGRRLQIIDDMFSCSEDDCTPVITAARRKFDDFMTKSFLSYTRCSLINYTPDCAQILLQTRSPVFESAENIFTSLLTCAKLRSAPQRGNNSQFGFLGAIAPIVRPECNCLKTDDLPIPNSENECYSADYVATLRNFIKVNFRRIKNAYKSNKTPHCNFSDLEAFVEQFKENALQTSSLLEEPSPTFVELDQHSRARADILMKYVPAIRQYVLDNDKSCYYTARRTRPNPMKITDEVITILSKCIGYRDTC